MINIEKNQSAKNQLITIFEPLPKSKRIKVHIPFTLRTERTAFKKIDSSFHYPTQKLWSVINTNQSMAELKKLFADLIQVKKAESSPNVPVFTLSEKSLSELDQNH